MKKTLYILITCIFILSFIVCGTVQTSAAGQTKNTTGNTTKTETTTKSSKDDTKKTSAKDDTKKSGDEIELYQKYEPLISMLEDGDYRGANEYVNDLHYEAKKKADAEADDEPIMDIVVGTYIDPRDGFSVTFNPNYTVEYENSTDLFSIRNLSTALKDIDTKKDFFIYVSPDGTGGQQIRFTYNDIIDAYEFGMSDHNGVWHNMVREDLIEIVELTIDNYEDYFEIVDSMYYDTDAFGDAKDVFIGKAMKLKEGIKAYDVEGAIAYNYVAQKCNVLSIDTDTLTFEFGNKIDNTSDSGERTNELGKVFNYNSDQDEFLYFGCKFLHSNVVPSGDEMTSRMYEIEITKIKGSLFLIK